MSGGDHNPGSETKWLVQHYDSAWGGWRIVQDVPDMTEAAAKAAAKRLGRGSTFKYRAVPRPEVSS